MRHRLRAHPDTPKREEKPRVDRDGHGRINGLSIATKGEALGHGFSLDDVSIDQVVDLARKAKGRWTHGNLCADGLGKHLGRIDPVTVRRDGDHAVGDFLFSRQAHQFKPDGLTVSAAEFLMDAAENEPDTLGMSIVFEGELVEAEDGSSVARMTAVPRVDFVADPAANPLGMFVGTGSELSSAVTEQLDEIISEIGQDRALSFALSYFGSRGIKMRRLGVHEDDADDKGESKDSEGEEKSNGAKARAGIAKAEANGNSRGDIAEATGSSAEDIGEIKDGTKEPSDEFISKINALVAKGKKGGEDKEKDEEMSALSVTNASLARQLTVLKRDLVAANDQLATFRQAEIDGYLLSLSEDTTGLNAPIDQADLDMIRGLMENGADEMARKMGAAVLRTAALLGGKDFDRKATDPVKGKTEKHNSALSRLLRAQGFKVEVDETTGAVISTAPSKE